MTSFHFVEDKEQRREMEATARGFGTPLVGYYQDATPGLLTSCAERMGKITVGGEFGWGEAVNADGVAMARRGILSAAVRHDVLRSPAPEHAHYPPEEQVLADASGLNCYVLSPAGGIFEPTVPCGSYTEEGSCIANLHDFDRVDDAPLTLHAPHDGYVMSQAWAARVTRGQVVSVVAPKRAWMD